MTEQTEKKNPLRSKYCGGPHGLGDPDDLSLRIVEKDVLIAKKMRDIARTEKCVKEVEQFTECCKSNQILMTFKCKQETAALKECLTRWYQDEDFKAKCTKEYLEERSEYRRTGIPQKQRQLGSQRIGSSM
ncbi:COX assembly mitochondrial protein homolog [Anoplophora glabripennis]|uniref:COX assembly mitochondrial protein homolog n=1 Tax=Anoplophora glabripennis TaxID=217634 RepID=UPI0008736ADF|nr:COX assembly mitochondrial protein homolog [Anoplophora glabripennis]